MVDHRKGPLLHTLLATDHTVGTYVTAIGDVLHWTPAQGPPLLPLHGSVPRFHGVPIVQLDPPDTLYKSINAFFSVTDTVAVAGMVPLTATNTVTRTMLAKVGCGEAGVGSLIRHTRTLASEL